MFIGSPVSFGTYPIAFIEYGVEAELLADAQHALIVRQDDGADAPYLLVAADGDQPAEQLDPLSPRRWNASRTSRRTRPRRPPSLPEFKLICSGGTPAARFLSRRMALHAG